MSNASNFILLPFLFAFLVFCWRFYVKEAANSMLNLSFLLALATVASVVTYLILGVTHMLPDYGTIGFGVVGLAMLGLAVCRIFIL